MSLLVARRAPQAESRDISTYPWTNGQTVPTNLQSPVAGYGYVSGDAFRVAAMVAALGLRSGAFAQIPLKGYTEAADGSSVLLRPQPMLLDDPSEMVVPAIWKTQMSISRDVWGYAAGLIKGVDASGQAARVDWYLPDELTATSAYVGGPLNWKLKNTPIDASLVLHVPSRWVMPGRPLGMSPLEKSGLLDLARKAQDFGRDWFTNGAIPSAILYSDQTITATQADDLLDRLKARWRRRQPGVLGSGMKYEPISVTANESQFLDTMIKVASDIAISFNLPPSKIAASMQSSEVKYSNIEASQAHYLMDSVNPDLVVTQEVIGRHMKPGTFCRWETGAFLRSDLKTRYESYQIGLSAGFLTADEVRAKEDMPPMPPVLAPVGGGQ